MEFNYLRRRPRMQVEYFSCNCLSGRECCQYVGIHEDPIIPPQSVRSFQVSRGEVLVLCLLMVGLRSSEGSSKSGQIYNRNIIWFHLNLFFPLDKSLFRFVLIDYNND